MISQTICIYLEDNCSSYAIICIEYHLFLELFCSTALLIPVSVLGHCRCSTAYPCLAWRALLESRRGFCAGLLGQHPGRARGPASRPGLTGGEVGPGRGNLVGQVRLTYSERFAAPCRTMSLWSIMHSQRSSLDRVVRVCGVQLGCEKMPLFHWMAVVPHCSMLQLSTGFWLMPRGFYRSSDILLLLHSPWQLRCGYFALCRTFDMNHLYIALHKTNQMGM